MAQTKKYNFMFRLSDGTTHTVPIEIPAGEKGDPGKTPVKGIDYFTDAEKKEMVSEVLAALPVYNGEMEDA